MAFSYLKRLLRTERRTAAAEAPDIRIDFAGWDVERLAAAWRSARPFGHVVIDELVPARDLAALRQAMLEQTHERTRGELFDIMASPGAVTHPALRALHQALGGPAGLATITAIIGKPASKVVMRAFTYVDGSYLLPHTDHRDDFGRQIAFAYYIATSGTGGELELFDCTVAAGEIVDVRPGVRIPAINNRLVLFDVGPGSLHEVREVIGGRRFSVSGWFYA